MSKQSTTQTVLLNVATSQRIEQVIQKHMTTVEYATKHSLATPVVSVLMDMAHSQNDRAQVLASAVASFVTESAAALSNYDNLTVQERVDCLAEDATGIISQVVRNLSESEDTARLMQLNRAQYEDADGGEVTNEITIEASRMPSAIRELFEGMMGLSDGEDDGNCGECAGCKARIAREAQAGNA